MAISNFISTVWSENLLKQLDKKYVAAAHCNRDFEGEIKNKGSKVVICGIGDITVSDYTKDTDMNAPETLYDYSNTLEIDRAKYFNFQIDDVDRAQSNPKLMDLAMKNAAEALANEADRYIYSLYNETSNSVMVEDTTKDNIIDSIIKAKTIMLKDCGVTPDDIVLEVTPEVAAVIIKAKMDICTNNNSVVEAGLLGDVAGCKVYVSNNVVIDENSVHQCMMRTKRAIAFAEQISEVEAYRPEKRFADAVKGLHLYGAKLVYPQEMVVIECGFANN